MSRLYLFPLWDLMHKGLGRSIATFDSPLTATEPTVVSNDVLNLRFSLARLWNGCLCSLLFQRSVSLAHTVFKSGDRGPGMLDG